MKIRKKKNEKDMRAREKIRRKEAKGENKERMLGRIKEKGKGTRGEKERRREKKIPGR